MLIAWQRDALVAGRLGVGRVDGAASARSACRTIDKTLASDAFEGRGAGDAAPRPRPSITSSTSSSAAGLQPGGDLVDDGKRAMDPGRAAAQVRLAGGTGHVSSTSQRPSSSPLTQGEEIAVARRPTARKSSISPTCRWSSSAMA